MRKVNSKRYCRYTPEKKLEIVTWCRENGSNYKLAAKQFHVAPNSIRTWINDCDIATSLSVGTNFSDSKFSLKIEMKKEEEDLTSEKKLDVCHRENGSNFAESSVKFGGLDPKTISRWIAEEDEFPKETKLMDICSFDPIVLSNSGTSLDVEENNENNQLSKKRTRYTPEEKLSVIAWHRENGSDLYDTSKQFTVEPGMINQWISQEANLLEMVSKKVDSYSLLSCNTMDLEPPEGLKVECESDHLPDPKLHHSHKERMSIIQWHLKNGSDVHVTTKKFCIQPHTLRRWLRLMVNKRSTNHSPKVHKRYETQEKQKILSFYFQNGSVIAKTCRKFSVDPRTIRSWIAEHIREGKKLPDINNSSYDSYPMESKPIVQQDILNGVASLHDKHEHIRQHKYYTQEKKASIILWHIQNGRRFSRTALQFGATHSSIRSWIKYEAQLLKDFFSEEDFQTVLQISKEIPTGLEKSINKQRKIRKWRSRFKKGKSDTTFNSTNEKGKLDLKVPVLKIHRMDISKKKSRVNQDVRVSDSVDDYSCYSTSENGDEYFSYEPLPGSIDESDLNDDCIIEDPPEEPMNSQPADIPEETELIFEVAEEDAEEDLSSPKSVFVLSDQHVNDQQYYENKTPGHWRNIQNAIKTSGTFSNTRVIGESKTVAISQKSSTLNCLSNSPKSATGTEPINWQSSQADVKASKNVALGHTADPFICQKEVFHEDYIRETCHLFGEFVAINLLDITPNYLKDLAKLDIQKILIKYKAQSYGHL